MAELFRRHVTRIEAWINEQPNLQCIYVDYQDALESPLEQAERISQFLGDPLNATEMAGVVDPTLYRQRH
jgi:hypothetical protein